MADSPWDMLSAIGTVTAVVVALGGFRSCSLEGSES